MGHTSAIGTLLAAGALPAQPDSHSCLPIHVAAACGHAAAVRLLLAALPHSATVTSNDGHTPLFAAVLNEKEEVVS